VIIRVRLNFLFYHHFGQDHQQFKFFLVVKITFVELLVVILVMLLVLVVPK